MGDVERDLGGLNQGVAVSTDGRSAALRAEPLAASQAEPAATNAVTPIDRLRKIMRRIHLRAESGDRGPLRGLSEIRQAHGGTKDEVRGLLIKLTATGEVEPLVCSNGVYWRTPKSRSAVASRAVKPKLYVLQREASAPAYARGQWFDAETFESREEADRRLKYRRWEEQARINGNGGSGYTMEHPQRMRVIKLVTETPKDTHHDQ